MSDVVRQSRERWKTCTGLSNSQTNLPTHEVSNRQCRAKRSVAMRRGMAHSVTLSDKLVCRRTSEQIFIPTNVCHNYVRRGVKLCRK